MSVSRTLLAGCLIAALATTATAAAGNTCKDTAKLQKQAAAHELQDDFKIAMAICANLTDPDERQECADDAKAELDEGKELAKDQYEARLDLCKKLGGGAYDPPIDPVNFSTTIDNPYFPLPVGAEWIYEAETEDGLEVNTVTVLSDTREILGVECVSVHDEVSVDGELTEDTIDWYAQDTWGNVWYFGEISFSLEEGYVVSIDGSWTGGVDGAKPGVVMMAVPTVGVTYRQEWLPGDAEDVGTVSGDNETVDIDIGTYTMCVMTDDFSPVEPGVLEHKFYAPGIGFVLETNPDNDETLELVSVSGL